jgi:hypothetical protein
LLFSSISTLLVVLIEGLCVRKCLSMSGLASSLRERLELVASPGRLGTGGDRSLPVSVGPSVGIVVLSAGDIGLVVCGGKSGRSGVRMCVAAPGEDGRCLVKAHTSKATWPVELDSSERMVLIGAPNKEDVVLMDKLWKAKELGPGLSDLLEETKTPLEWQLILDNMSIEGNRDTLEDFAARVKASSTAMTPRPKRNRYDDVLAETPELDEFWMDVDAGAFGADMTSATQQKRVREALPSLVSNTQGLRSQFSRLQDIVYSLRRDIGQDVDGLALALGQLNLSLGERPPVFGLQSVWTYMSALSTTVEEVQARSDSQEVLLGEKVAQIAASTIEQELTSGTVFDILSAGYSFARRFTIATGPGGSMGRDIGDVLESRLVALEISTASRPNQHGRGMPAAPQVPAQPIVDHAALAASEVQARLHALETKMQEKDAAIARLHEDNLLLKNQLKATNAALASDGCEILNRQFESMLAVQQFVADNRVAEFPVAWIDVVALLQFVNNPITDNSEAVAQEANAIKAGYSDSFQSTLATSYRLTLPRIFNKSSSSVTEGAALSQATPLPGLKTYEEWDTSSSTSARSLVESELVTTEKAINEFVDASDLSPLAKEIAMRLVTDAHNFISKLFTFMQRFYYELRNTYSTSDKEAWFLVASIVKQCFVDMNTVRARARMMSVSGERPEVVGSTFLWAALQSRRIAMAYIKHDFRNHPSVAPVITIHLYGHRVSTGVFDAKVKKMELDITKALTDAKAAKAVADRAASSRA